MLLLFKVKNKSTKQTYSEDEKMGRHASELTVAIRNLCEETNFAVTHLEARLVLKPNFELAPDSVNELNTELSLFDTTSDSMRFDQKYEVDIGPFVSEFVKVVNSGEFNQSDYEQIRAVVFKNLGWDHRKGNAVLRAALIREIGNRKLLKNERNLFDVTKYNWKVAKEHKSLQKSQKPKKAEPELIQGPKADRSDVKQAIAALNFIERQGGVQAVEKKVSGMKDEIEDMKEELAKKESELKKLLDKIEAVQKLAGSIKAA